MKKTKTPTMSKWAIGSLLTICLLAAALPAAAQDDRQVRSGMKGGVNLANLYIDHVNE